VSHSHLMQAPDRPGGCWACRHWHGETASQGTHAVCRFEPGAVSVKPLPQTGCAFWQYDGRWKTRREYQYPKRRPR